MTNTKPKTKIFRVGDETGNSFKAVAELLEIEHETLLEAIMEEYVSSVRKSIGEVAMKFPAFRMKYPFV